MQRFNFKLFWYLHRTEAEANEASTSSPIVDPFFSTQNIFLNQTTSCSCRRVILKIYSSLWFLEKDFRLEPIPLIDDLPDEEFRLFKEMLNQVTTEESAIPEDIQDIIL